MSYPKSYNQPGFWQYLHQNKMAGFHRLIVDKARYLNALEQKDLFAMPIAEALKLQKLMHRLTEELQLLYDFEQYILELQKHYESPPDNTGIPNTENYHQMIYQIQHLNQQVAELQFCMNAAIDNGLFLHEMIENKINPNHKNPKL